MLIIREAHNDELNEIKKVVAAAFEREDEANLVQAIYDSPYFETKLSLVAELNGQIVGHILFSRILIHTKEGDRTSLALAPVSVLPAFQNQAIGAELITEGLKRCAELGFGHVVVLGHPNYYPRFGFVPASTKNIKAPFDVPDEAFMVCELVPDALADIEGMVLYPAAFLDV